VTVRGGTNTLSMGMLFIITLEEDLPAVPVGPIVTIRGRGVAGSPPAGPGPAAPVSGSPTGVLAVASSLGIRSQEVLLPGLRRLVFRHSQPARMLYSMEGHNRVVQVVAVTATRRRV
jgi:hypothetical protein